MTYEELSSRVRSTLGGRELAALLEASVGQLSWHEEEFRTGVVSALETGYFNLVIAVDEIDDHLRRMIRYLNLTGKPEFRLAAFEMERFELVASHGRVERRET